MLVLETLTGGLDVVADTAIGAHLARLLENSAPDRRDDTQRLLDSLELLIIAREDAAGEKMADLWETGVVSRLASNLPGIPIQSMVLKYLTEEHVSLA